MKNPPRFCQLLIPLVVPVALWGLACNKTPSPAEQLGNAPKPLEVQVGQSIFEPESEEFMERYQPHVQMAARWESDRVLVSVLNRTTQTITVSAANFAVIVYGDLHRVTNQSAVSQFPETDLAPQAAASGTIKFINLGNLTGRSLVFYHPPEVRPSMCIIKSARSSPPTIPQGIPVPTLKK